MARAKVQPAPEAAARRRYREAASKMSSNAYYYALGKTDDINAAATFAALFQEALMDYFEHRRDSQPVIEKLFEIWSKNS